MNNQSDDIDLLIRRLKGRAADPERRTDYRPSVFDDRVRKLDLAGLFAEGMRAGNDLRRLVEANQQGRVPPDLVARAEEIADEMETRVSTGLPSAATAASLTAVELELGMPVPHLLRRIYGEVADGGFGPSAGLLPLAGLSELYFELLEGSLLPRGRQWPKHLLPIVQESPAILCIDTSAPEGPIVAWDPEDLSEYAGAASWSRSFTEEAPSLQAWLEQWLDGPAPEEQFQAKFGDQIMASQIEAARQSRAMIAAMSPEERATMGLPEVGWEAVVWGGLGWDGTQGPGST